LSKDLFGTNTSNNLNTSGGGGTSWSLCSPQQLGIIQTSATQATPILQNLTLLNSGAQPIELTSANGANNYIITSQLVNNGSGRQGEVSFLDATGASQNGSQATSQLSTLKLIGQVDLAGTPKSISLLDAQLQQQHAQQPQFAELKSVGLLNSDAFMSKLNLLISEGKIFNY